MLSQALYRARQISRQLWVRAALISLLAFVTAGLAPIIAPFVPSGLLLKINEETVRSLLDIIANSMLAVTTFSLTIMVTTHLAASQQVTPRAHRILREDTRTQTVLATFIGAFVFSMTSIVLIQVDLIGTASFALLYIATLFVLALVILAILRWIGHLAHLGSVEETTRKVQESAQDALSRRMNAPFMGGHPYPATDDIPSDAHDVVSPTTGYVLHIDTSKLSETVGALDALFYITATPGDWVGVGDRLGAMTCPDMTDAEEQELYDCFSIGDTRTFAQDGAFGISVLTEIAERALSPGINDPQTAIDVVARLLMIFESLDAESPAEEPAAPNVFVPALNLHRMIESGFDPIARDGKGQVEIQMSVQTALRRLSRHRNSAIAEAARITSARALAWAEIGLPLDADRARITEIAVAKDASSHR